MSADKYTMTLDLNILRHLGLNLYSNISAVLSEAVANAWDADAKNVYISLGDDLIEIKDDGFGMTEDDINEKYLRVGRKKRDKGEKITPHFKRPVMGRKGIGKLSLFSIANIIIIQSVKGASKSAFKMSTSDIESQVLQSNGIYHPTDLGSSAVTILEGTKIILRDIKKTIDNSDNQLRKKLARRFSVIGKNFNVYVDGIPVTVADRDFYKNLEFVWPINEPIGNYDSEVCPNIKNYRLIDGFPDNNNEYLITGWIGSVENTKLLSESKERGITDNKIILLARGKLIQENILEQFNIGSIYAKYLIGEINADFLDTDEADDIATSNRQSVIEDDPRYQQLIGYVFSVLQKIKKDWEGWRAGLATEKAIDEFPVLQEWYDQLKPATRKTAETLFATIQNLHFDKEEDTSEKKKELYKQGILAFERLRVKENLAALEDLQTATDFKFASIFTDVNEIEALLYYDIASQRVAVIRELTNIVDNNMKEKVIQEHLFDNLWLLNPSWERATKGSELLEQRIYKEFADVDKNSLTDEEIKGRFDIKYRTSAGKHIIIELKRYNPGYKITKGMLIDQVEKYVVALKKCLKAVGKENEPIEVICILGNSITEDREGLEKSLRASNARLKYYDELIEESLQGYSEFMNRNQEVNRLKNVIERL